LAIALRSDPLGSLSVPPYYLAVAVKEMRIKEGAEKGEERKKKMEGRKGRERGEGEAANPHKFSKVGACVCIKCSFCECGLCKTRVRA